MNIDIFQNRAWAEVDLSALQHNFLQLKNLVSPQTKMLVAVKANAYGHGAVPCAKALLAAGANYLAVATAEEALELRNADISAPILILGDTPKNRMADMVARDVTMAVFSVKQAQMLSEEAQRQNKTACIHIKVNTGMERIGFAFDAKDDILAACNLPCLYPEGIFSHLACADEPDPAGAKLQFERFSALLNALGQAGRIFPLRHIANSAAIINFPEFQLDMVRAGIALYGYYPSEFVHKERAELLPVMSVRARVTHLHEARKGAGVSYGWTYRAEENVTLATVPVGYADGYFRLFSGKAHMLVHGKAVPVTGRICMDQCMIDVTSVNTIDVGDEITIIGKQKDAEITADDLANLIGTISYEILCATGERLPRLYLQDGSFSEDVLNGSN